MTPLSSLRADYRAVMFGASGGIGGALCELLRVDTRCGKIYAGARHAPPKAEKLEPFFFDLTNEGSIAEASRLIGASETEIDLIIVATGVLHNGTLQPEKTMRALDPEKLAHSYAINAIGPALIAKHFLPLLPRGRKSVFAALSARVGSIADNQLGGWHGYRASKAALNQLIRTSAIELAVKRPQAICVTLHPGTVDTFMSKPFQNGVTPERLFTPLVSAGHLISVIDALTPASSGGFIAWNGADIPF